MNLLQSLFAGPPLLIMRICADGHPHSRSEFVDALRPLFGVLAPMMAHICSEGLTAGGFLWTETKRRKHATATLYHITDLGRQQLEELDEAPERS